MSDTSVISTMSSYEDHGLKRIDGSNENPSCCARYWFIMISSLLSVIIIITSILIMYFLNKQAERDRKRQNMKDEFKHKHQVTSKVLDMIMKDGIVYKWINAHKGSIATTFKELFTDISKTLFDE